MKNVGYYIFIVKSSPATHDSVELDKLKLTTELLQVKGPS